MSNLSKLETSYNRQIQIRIFEQLDLIDKAKAKYFHEKNKYKMEYLDKVNPLITNLQREKALLKGYRKDYHNALRVLKREYLNQVFELKESKKFNINETKQNLSLLMAKIDLNYKKVKSGYIKAIKSGDKEAKSKYENFEQQFKEYRRLELEKRIKERDSALENINNTYHEKLSKIKACYEAKKAELVVNHTKEIQFKYKKEKREHIKQYLLDITKFKNEKKAKELENKNKLVSVRTECKKMQKDAKAEIKKIKAEVRKTVHNMSSQERKEYHELQKYIRQDFYVRRLKKMDAQEKKLLRNINPAYIYIAPAFFGALFFTLVPFFFMIIGSLFRVNFANLSDSEFMGLQNFIRIFTRDVEFQKALINTALYAFITIVLLTVITVSMAAWLSKNTQIHNMTQTMVFTPHIASLVSISILWIAMLNPTGIINQGLALLGIKGPAWLLQENTSLFSVSLVTVWKDIGYYVLIIIAGLQGIPTYVYEAAKLDKASKVTTFFKITLPLLAPTLSFVFLAKFINAFKVFAPIEIMTNGGPMGSSMVLSYWVYKVGRIGFNYGQAMAGAIILTMMIALVTSLKNLYFNKVTKY